MAERASKTILSGPLSGRKLILASNRAPCAPRIREGVLQWEMGLGGLITALDPVMQSVGGVWVAWEDTRSGESDINFTRLGASGAPARQWIDGVYGRVSPAPARAPAYVRASSRASRSHASAAG